MSHQRVTDLRVMGAWWYARFSEGGFSMDGPTSFPATMSRDDVVAAIKAKSPDAEIDQ